MDKKFTLSLTGVEPAVKPDCYLSPAKAQIDWVWTVVEVGDATHVYNGTGQTLTIPHSTLDSGKNYVATLNAKWQVSGLGSRYRG